MSDRLASKEILLRKITDRSAKLCIIGLGYVGLPLAIEFGKAGFSVVGIDLDGLKCARINAGESYIGDVPDEIVAQMVQSGQLRASADNDELSDADVAIICVPTPLGKSKDPDISYIVAAADQLSEHMHPGILVVLESTTYPGTTEEVLLPRIAANGDKVGRDFFLAFSPERVDPGNRKWNTHNTPKVVGGMTPDCLDVAMALYQTAVQTLVPVSSPAVAEMVKILENTFRAVNIGFVNEMAQICHRIDMDIWEVIAAAKTKPFGFMPFYPGPGLGGHCIPSDPFYLSWKARTHNFTARFIELAGEINSAMPGYVVARIMNALNEKKKSLAGARIVILGVTYKKNISDTRESPAIEIIHLLREKGAEVSFVDPHVTKFVTDNFKLKAKLLDQKLLKSSDAVVIVADHDAFDYKFIVKNSPLIIDTRNATKEIPHRHNVIKL